MSSRSSWPLLGVLASLCAGAGLSSKILPRRSSISEDTSSLELGALASSAAGCGGISISASSASTSDMSGISCEAGSAKSSLTSASAAASASAACWAREFSNSEKPPSLSICAKRASKSTSSSPPMSGTCPLLPRSLRAWSMLPSSAGAVDVV